MKVGLLCLVTVLLSGQRTELSGLGRVADTSISDSSLIADGCEDHVELVKSDSLGNAVRYKPTPATLPVYKQGLQAIHAARNSIVRSVRIRFIETGRQVELFCGWGHKLKVGEIDLLEVKPR